VNRGSISKFRRLQEQASAFFHERDIARRDHRHQSVTFRCAHFWLLVIKSFIRNRCPVRASALAYTTLLAIVPLLAVGVSITTSVLQKEGKEGRKPIDELINTLVKNVAPALDLKAADGAAENNRNEVVAKISDFIDNIQSGTLGVTSTIALVFVAIGLLRTIEAAFNDIWGVTSGRGWVASIIQYWATITLGPVILVVVLGLSTGPQFQRMLSVMESSKLSPDDITDFPGLATKLSRHSDPLSDYLASRLETSLQASLSSVASNGVSVTAKAARRALVDNLNQIIAGPSIYEEQRFATVTLLPATKALVTEHVSRSSAGEPAAAETPTPRLNRQLLDAAYPLELAPKKPPFFEGLFFQILPFVVLSLAFGMFYQFMPNTPVQWRAALAGGVVGGTLWQLNNKLSVLYVSKAVEYSKIYGSLGIIPLLLVGMYFSWLILLFGAQVAYAYQNRQAYLEEKQSDGVNQRGREFIALRILTQVARSFATGEKPSDVPHLAESLGVPTKLVAQLMGVLLRANLVVEVSNSDVGYVPARPIGSITIQDVLYALRVGTGQELEPRDDGLLARVRLEFERVGGAEKSVAGAVTIEDLVKGQSI
jgi:YihY family inner membrane protein